MLSELDAAIHINFHSTALARLQYASSAWYGFLDASSREKIETFVWGAKRGGYTVLKVCRFFHLSARGRTINYFLK